MPFASYTKRLRKLERNANAAEREMTITSAMRWCALQLLIGEVVALFGLRTNVVSGHTWHVKPRTSG